MDAPRVVIGEILRAHGVRGAMRVRPTGATLEDLRPGEAVTLVPREGAARPATVVSVSPGPILTLDGVDDRDAADALRGARVEVPEARLPAPTAADEFYVRDLVGCEVLLDGAPIGTVGEVHTRPANDVLEVRRDGADPVLLPFTHDAVREVDLAARRIVVRADILGEDA
ncbi:MAG: 16S rRNA processing protein RimM [Thermoleophilia bacterium]|nr:16S rRNA processing protein RimM [Thermoleophilia bacterium]